MRSRANSAASRSICGGRTSSPPPSCPTGRRPACKLDTGDYVAALDIARDMIDLPAIRKRQAAARTRRPRGLA